MKKRHHTQSKFYLRRFAIPSTKQGEPNGFWVYRRGHGSPQWLSAETVCIHSHFYSYVDESGKRNAEIEDLLGDVESRAAPVVERLMAAGFAALDNRERNTLALFVALAYARTPKTRRVIVEAVERRGVSNLKALAEDGARLAASVSEFNAARGGTLSAEDARGFIADIVSGEATVRLGDRGQVGYPLVTVEPLCGLLMRMNWRLLEAPPGVEFVTSDDPVVMAGEAGDPDPFKSGRLEVTLPLDPRHCLLLTWAGPPLDIVGSCSREWAGDVVRRTAAGADQEVYAARKSPIVARSLR